jgi:flagellar hook assembly protein FlgD
MKICFKKKHIMIIFLILFIVFPLIAALDTKGTDFWTVKTIKQQGKAGCNAVNWDCSNENNKTVGSGVFICKIEASSGSQKQWLKVAVIK